MSYILVQKTTLVVSQSKGETLFVTVDKPIKSISIEQKYCLSCSYFFFRLFVILIPCSPSFLIRLSRAQLETQKQS